LNFHYKYDCIGDEMVSMLSLSAVDQEPWSGKTKDYKIGVCFFLANHTGLRKAKTDWLTSGLLF
jgi:hypothetical protein